MNYTEKSDEFHRKNPTFWWQSTSIYQIYPLSFKDSNGDGIGDIPGIIEKLPYIQWLGFETIWISPFFLSPWRDHGYDVSSYLEIDPKMGSPADVEILLDEAHRLGLRVLFDFVLNHTSDQHPWFQESRSSRTNAKRDWYIWRSGDGSGPPNNWISMVGKSGWNYDSLTDAWYYSNFLPFQPDLNYRNLEVQRIMLEMARYWLRRGVDGFRLDIFNSIFKDAAFRSNPPSRFFFPRPQQQDRAFFQTKRYTLDLPECVDFARQLRATGDAEGSKLLLGEVSGNAATLRRYLGNGQDALGLVFNFATIEFEFSASFFYRLLLDNDAYFGEPYWPTLVFGNHDQPRAPGRVAGDAARWKLLTMLQFTARGVPVTYYGEEIGMLDGNVPIKSGSDPLAKANRWVPKALARWLDVFLVRDDCRTPMQWDGSKHGGFCAATVSPWNPLGQKPGWHVVQQRNQPDSILHHYRSLLKLRRQYESLSLGRMREISCRDKLLSYQRQLDAETTGVYLNFGEKGVELQVPTFGQLLAVGEVGYRGTTLLLGPTSGVLVHFS